MFSPIKKGKVKGMGFESFVIVPHSGIYARDSKPHLSSRQEGSTNLLVKIINTVLRPMVFMRIK
jgi:hypothetical protein